MSGTTLSHLLELVNDSGALSTEDMAPYLGGKDELQKLEVNLSQIRGVLLDAEWLAEATDVDMSLLCLEQLVVVLGRLKSLLEHVRVALDHQEADEQLQTLRGKLLTKIFVVLFSRPSHIPMKASEAKAILDELKAWLMLFGRSFCSRAPRVNLENQPEGSSSCGGGSSSTLLASVPEESVIGRADDKKEIIRMLLEFHDDNVVVMPIIGISGIGKTTIAQCVFTDEEVQNHFELIAWACVSEISTMERLMRKILQSISSGAKCHHLTIEELEDCLVKAVSNKRYLLVLDDIGNEDLGRLLELRRLLGGGKKGSKILVTSTSEVVAEIKCGMVKPYNLKGLAEDMSWKLFKRIAFRVEKEEINPNLRSLGLEIYSHCHNVPLLLKIIASLLCRDHTEYRWLLVWDSLRKHENSFLSTFNLSYNHLPPHLKQCFTYCSLLPKDYYLSKIDLIQHWISQGFIRPSTRRVQSLWDMGNECFNELVDRGFFQVAKTENSTGTGTTYFSIHNLMVDFAQSLTRNKYLLIEDPQPKRPMNRTIIIQHMSFVVGSSWKAPSWLPAAKQLRSLLFLPWNPHEFVTIQNVDNAFSSLSSLRALDLAAVRCETLPESIAQLKHLRYLRLGVSSESLPDFILDLKSLKTLDLRLSLIRNLPRDFNKLINLKHLHIGDTLIHLLLGFEQLTSLQTLQVLSVGENNELKTLISLNDVDEKLKFRQEKRPGTATASNVTVEVSRDDQDLTVLSFVPSRTSSNNEADQGEFPSPLLPPRESLGVWCQDGVSNYSVLLSLMFLRREKDVLSSFWLPNIICLIIEDCSGFKTIRASCQLAYLKRLHLRKLKDLEYITSVAAACFPSLECLELYELRGLKKWSRLGKAQFLDYFPSLMELKLSGCPKLMSMPRVPKLKSLYARAVPWKLLLQLLSAKASSINQSSLKDLVIERCEEFGLVDDDDDDYNDLETVWVGDEDDKGISPSSVQSGAWGGLHKSLCSLTLRDFEKLESLPQALGCLTMLQELYISWLYNLRALPEWIKELRQLRKLDIRHCHKLSRFPPSLCDLTQLQHLRIVECPKLEISCRQPDGIDWPLIQHIPHLVLGLPN